MTGQFDFTAILFLVVAVVVFLKLRSVLGRRTEDDEARIERFRNQRAAHERQQQDQTQGRAADGKPDGKVVTLPRREREAPKAETAVQESNADRDLRMTKFAGGNAPLAKGLIAISQSDRTFDPSEFMKGAKAAYEMIVMAFAEGNRSMLRDLLSPEVFTGFDGVIKAREAARETIEQSFVGISAADMIEAEVKTGTAHVTVKFVSELISAVRGQTGDVLSGDPKRIKEVTDIWTFARDVAATNPNWKLVATQAAN